MTTVDMDSVTTVEDDDMVPLDKETQSSYGAEPPMVGPDMSTVDMSTQTTVVLLDMPTVDDDVTSTVDMSDALRETCSSERGP